MAADASRVWRADESLRRGICVAVGRAAVDEELDAGALPARLRTGCDSRRPRRPAAARRAAVVHDEMRGIGEDRAEHARRRRRFERPVEVAHEIRRREMHAVVERVRRRAHGSGVRGPHRGGGRARGEKLGRVGRRARDDVGIRAGEAERAQRARCPARSCGGSTACTTPRAASARALASPCSAAARGFATVRAFRSAARLPRASPA